MALVVCPILATIVSLRTTLSTEVAGWTLLFSGSFSLLLTTVARLPADHQRSSRLRTPLWTLTAVVTTLAVVGFVFVRTNSVLSTAFFVAFIFFFAYVWFIVPLAVFQKTRSSSDRRATAPYLTVSVLIPAYNEEGYVGRCIDAVASSNYPHDCFEVVVVDDGSTDGTYEEALERTSHSNVTVHRKRNGGKHDALNYGIEHSTGDLVVIVDADSFVESDALSRVVGAFQADEEVGGIASNVKVLNRERGVTKLQTVEYILGINTFRRAFDYFNAIPVVPGCLGGFRREALEDVGGYEGDTLTEDFDVTLQVLKAGWSVRQTEATVWTEAPYSWRDLFRQRLRWNRGNLDVMFKHADILTDDRSGFLHRLVFPFRLVTLLLAPLASLAVLVAVGIGVVAGQYVTVAAMIGYFLAVGALLTVLVVLMEDEDLRLVPYFVPMTVVYRYFQAVTIAAALFSVLRSAEQGWGSVRREAQEQPLEER